MVKYENECVGCDLPCAYGACSYYHVPHYFCDRCGEETHKLYDFDGEQFCYWCVDETIEEFWDSFDLEEKAKMIDMNFREVEF